MENKIENSSQKQYRSADKKLQVNCNILIILKEKMKGKLLA